MNLRNYTETHMGETLPDVRGRRFVNALLSDCTFRKVAGAQFINSVLAGSKLDADDIRDFLGTTMTLDCFTFENLELSPPAFDAILFLLTMTRANDASRAKLEQVIDPHRLRLFRRLFPDTE